MALKTVKIVKGIELNIRYFFINNDIVIVINEIIENIISVISL